MTLLINGCSFARGWTSPSKDFLNALGVEKYQNISQVATGVQRLFRSTIEWIMQNDKPKFVVLCLPFVHRWELSIAQEENAIDGTWFPMQMKDLIQYQKVSELVDKSDLKKLAELYHRCIPDVRTYWDKAFSEIIGLTSFLDNNEIGYVLFDMCNNFEERHIKGYKGFKKLDHIKKNNSIIDLFEFCGNRHIYDNLKIKRNIDPYHHHHENADFVFLENYLVDYISSCIKK